jgi:activator of HSP90 ATPase
MTAIKGGAFSLWNSDITGKNTEVKKEKKLVQQWKYKGWEKDSRVTFTLVKKGKNTVVKLTHEGVESKHIKSIAGGWNAYYLGAIKELLESEDI